MLQKLKYFIERFPIMTLILIFIIAELIINPIGNFPLNDDWWYVDLYRKLFEEYTDQKVAWGAAGLWGQLLLTKPFAFFFGSSYTALRCFTLLLSLVATIFIFKICIVHLKMNTVAAFTISILFLFNPLFLCLSNSYMTDVPFVFLLLGGLYFYFLYKQKNSFYFLLLSVFFFVVGILTRQLMLGFLIGIVLTEMIISRKIALTTLLILFVPLLALFCFEVWMKNKVNNFIYTFVFFRTSPMLNEIPFTEVAINQCKRWIHYISISGSVLFPVLIPYLIQYFRSIKFRIFKKEFIIALLFYIPVFISILKFPLGNYLYNCGIGPNTLYDTFTDASGGNLGSPLIFMIMKIITYISSFSLVLAIVHFFSDSITHFDRQNLKTLHFSLVFMISAIFYYAFLNFSSGIFDRYTIPFTLMIVFTLHKQFIPVINKNYVFISLLFLLALFSTLGTKDYLGVNRTRWQAINTLKQSYKATDMQINAGYEHEGSCFANTNFWYTKWMNNPLNDYMVSKKTIKNYTILGACTYQRFIPFVTDTVFYSKLDTIPNK